MPRPTTFGSMWRCVVLSCLIVSCSGGDGETDAAASEDRSSASDQTQGPDVGVDGLVDAAIDQLPPDTVKAPLLTSAHEGWTYKWCDKCHPVPVVGHTETEPIACIACHGANGSCKPPADHEQSLDCAGCHGVRHTYGKNADCLTCHFAAQGVAPCSF